MTSTTLQRSDIAGLSAIDLGSGTPIVLLHGVGLCADAWGPQITAFCQSHRVIAPDMPGHGHSTRAAVATTLADFTDASARVLETLDTPAVVIGHSMGAMMALALAARLPDRVRGVAALNAIFARSPNAAQAVQQRADNLDGVTVPDPEPTLSRWFGAALSPERKACQTWLRTADPAGYKRAYTAFAYADGPSRHALMALPCPAVFVTGALEPNSTPEMSQAMANLAPRGRALIVEGAAHMMPMTHAGEVNAALLAFAQEAAA